jgi:hypothetical protein
LDALYTLLLEDDQARWKLIAWMVFVGGIIGAVDLVWFDSPVDDAILVMSVIALTIGIMGVGVYGFVGHPKHERPNRLALQLSVGILAVILSASISTVQANILNSQLASATSGNNLTQAAVVLNRAGSTKLRLNSSDTDEIKNRLLNMPNADVPGAWDALLAYASYASSTLHIPQVPQKKMAIGTRYGFEVPIDDPDWGKKIFVSEYQAPKNMFALFEPIGADVNKDLSVGPAWLILKNATVPVDRWHLRSVICIDCAIIYRGGPVLLENFYCANCTFEIAKDNKGFQFAKATILRGAGPITFADGVSQ